MYHFGEHIFGWNWESDQPDKSVRIAHDETPPKLKDVVLEIGVTLAVALAFVLVVNLALRLSAII